MSKRKLVILLIALLIFGSLGTYFFVKQKSGADIVEAETGTLSGAVTEVETGLPIAGAELWLSNPSVLGREKVIINTDEEGKFVEEGLAPDLNYNIRVAKVPNIIVQYNNQKIEIYSNKESVYEAKINNNGSITTSIKNGAYYSNIIVLGKLYTRDGEPIANRTIQIGKNTRVDTDESGLFQVNGIKRGIYPILINQFNKDQLTYVSDYGNEIPFLYVSGTKDRQQITLRFWKKIAYINPIPTREAETNEFIIEFIDFNGNPLSNTKVICTLNDLKKKEYTSYEDGKIVLDEGEINKCKEVSFNYNEERELKIEINKELFAFWNLGMFEKEKKIYKIPLPKLGKGILNAHIRFANQNEHLQIGKFNLSALLEDGSELSIWTDMHELSDNGYIFIEAPSGQHTVTVIPKTFSTPTPDYFKEDSKIQIINEQKAIHGEEYVFGEEMNCRDIEGSKTQLCYGIKLALSEATINDLLFAIKTIQNLVNTSKIPDYVFVTYAINSQATGSVEDNKSTISISSTYISNLNNPNVLFSIIYHEFSHIYDAYHSSMAMDMNPSTRNSLSDNENFQNKLYRAIFNYTEEEIKAADFKTKSRSDSEFLSKIVDSEFTGEQYAGHPWDNNMELFATDFHNYFGYHDTLVNVINGFGQNTENYRLGVFDYKFIRYMVDLASDNDYDFPVANSKENQDPFPCGNIFEGDKVWTAEQILNGDFLKCEEQQKPAALKGTVRDAKGGVIPGAKIEFTEKTYLHGDRITAITALEGQGIKGTYHIPDIPLKEGLLEETTPVKASYQYDASCPDQTVNVTLKSGQTTTQDFQLNCNPSPIVLGKITNQANNNPIAGANVIVDLPSPYNDLNQTTNALGQYIIPCNPNSPCPANGTSVNIAASANDFVPQDQTVTYQGNPITANFSLTTKGREADTSPPSLSHTPPSSPQPSTQDLKIQTSITDNVDVTEAKTYYRVEGQAAWQTIALTKKDNNNYESVIPKTAFVKDKKIQYYLSAKDAAGNSALNPTNAPSSYHSISFSWPIADTTPPVISNVKVLNITQTSATITWTTNESSTSRVEYGATNSYGSIKEDNNLVSSHSPKLEGLKANTTYYYRVISKDASGNQATYVSNVTFKTLAETPPADTTPPIISDIKATIANATTASITWNTNENATTVVQYGLTNAYGSTISNYSLVTSHKAVIGGLKMNTLYHYRVISKDYAGNQATSGDYTFKITDTTPPIIANLQVKYITQNTATIYWQTSEAATSRVDYGLTNNYGLVKEDNNLVTSHSIKLEGLQANTTYHYRVISKDASGNQATSADNIFKTQAPDGTDKTPPVILNIKTKALNGRFYINFQTDEPTRTSVQFGLTQSYGKSLAGEADYNTAHSTNWAALAGKTYHYRIIAKDVSGNQTTSQDYQFNIP